MEHTIDSYSQPWSNKLDSLMESRRRSGKEAWPGIQDYQGCPNCRMEEDVLIALDGTRLLGYAAGVVECGISRVIGDVYVLPSYREKGVGTSLLNAFRRRAQETSREIHIPVYMENEAGRSFLARRRFVPVRQFLELENRRLNAGDINPVLFEMDAFSPDESWELAEIQNQVFRGSWGFNPNNERDISFYKNETQSDWDDILKLKIKGKTAGYIWTCPPSKERNGKTGRIHMCGLLEDCRGRGLSEILVAAGLEHLAEKGAEAVCLNVDADNRAALKLYRKMGFQEIRRIVWYKEKLNQK